MADVQWALISVATASLAHFLLRIVLGKDLGAEGLGIYTLAFSFYLIGQNLAGLGIDGALTKYVAEYLEDSRTVRDYVSSGITSSIITGTVMGIVLFILAPFIAISFFHTPQLEDMIKLVAICFPFIAIQKAVLGTLNGHRRMRLFAFLNVVQNVAIVTISIALVLWLDMGVMGAVIGFVLPTMVIGALCPSLIRDCIGQKRSLWNIPALRATTAFGFFVGLGNGIGYINNQIDSLLIGFYIDPTEVGIYAVSMLFVQTLTLIPSAVQRVTAPATASLYGKGDVEGVRALFYSTLKKSFILSIISALLLAISGPYLIKFFFTEEYLASYVPMLLLLIGYVFSTSYAAVGSTLYSIGKIRLPFRISIVCGVMNIILNIALIPILGISGAALAISLTMIANFVITMKIVKKYF